MITTRTGDRVGVWRVDQVLTYGSPALLAAHLAEDRSVRATLKVAERKRFAEARQRREVRALQSFDHPRIPKLIESGVSGDGSLFIALKPFSGDSLSDRLVAGPVDWRAACAWLYQIAVALQHIHDAGWVHRDLTPQNIYIGHYPREVWLLGLEGALPEAEREEIDHTFRGNMAYLAPEVLADPEHHGQRADLYAFGLVAYEVLSGEPAFPAATWAEQADRERSLLEWKTRSKELDPGPAHPDWLRGLVRKCTHPASERRLPDMDAVVAWMDGARIAWEAPEEPQKHTPNHVPPERLPRLSLQPTLVDAALFANALAERQMMLQNQQPSRMMHMLTASAMGIAAGLAASTMIVLYVELSRLG